MNYPLTLIEFVWVWNHVQGLGTPRHHRDISDFLSKKWHGEDRQVLLMAFRNSGKSTLVGLFCAWVLLTEPNTRVLILSADYELAKKMVRNIKRIIEHHPATKHLKPKQKDQWASDRFTIKRKSELRDPSVLARGLGANITGCRADLIICDDVEVPKTSETPMKRDDLRQKLSELDFVLVPEGMQLYVGTPHTQDTIYNTDENGFLHGFSKLLLPIVDEFGKSAWPERFPLEKIEALRRRAGPLKFLSQMLLKAVNLTESRLDISHLNRYADEIRYRESNQVAELKIGDIKMVSASCWWDPAFGQNKGDNSVIACVFCDEYGHYYLHDIQYLKVETVEESAKRQCEQVISFLKLYHLPQIYLETNGLGKFLPELLRQELKNNRQRCAVIEKTARIKKEARIIEAFDAILANRALFVHERVYKTPFVQEMKDWSPSSKTHDDGLDAVAGCLLVEPIRLSKSTPPPTQSPDWRFGMAFKKLSLKDIKI